MKLTLSTFVFSLALAIRYLQSSDCCGRNRGAVQAEASPDPPFCCSE